MHPAFGNINCNRTGVFGHSMGGFTTLKTGAQPQEWLDEIGVKAAFALMPGNPHMDKLKKFSSEAQVPMAYGAGQCDILAKYVGRAYRKNE